MFNRLNKKIGLVILFCELSYSHPLAHPQDVLRDRNNTIKEFLKENIQSTDTSHIAKAYEFLKKPLFCPNTDYTAYYNNLNKKIDSPKDAEEFLAVAGNYVVIMLGCSGQSESKLIEWIAQRSTSPSQKAEFATNVGSYLKSRFEKPISSIEGIMSLAFLSRPAVRTVWDPTKIKICAKDYQKKVKSTSIPSFQNVDFSKLKTSVETYQQTERELLEEVNKLKSCIK